MQIEIGWTRSGAIKAAPLPSRGKQFREISQSTELAPSPEIVRLERRKVDLIQHRAIIQRKGKGIGFICLLLFHLQLRNAEWQKLNEL